MRIVRRSESQLSDNLVAFTKRAQRKLALSLSCKHHRYAAVARCKVALPFGISGVGICEAFKYGEGGLIGGERGGEVALDSEHVADPVMRDGQVALPFGISGVGLGEAFAYGEGGLIGGERGGEVARELGTCRRSLPA